MADITYLFNNFLLGEINPQMQGQTNSPLYKVSCKEATNVKITREAAITRRSGSLYKGILSGTTETFLLDFEHSNGSTYQLEFFNLKFRIWKEGVIQGAPTEVTTIYETDDLAKISFDIDNDQIYLTDGQNPIQVITRASDTSWSIADISFTCPPMFQVDHPTYGRTEELGNTSTTISSLSSNTLNGSATLVMSTALFEAADVGKYIRIKNFTSNPADEANATVETTTTSVNVITQLGATALTNTTNGVSVSAVPQLTVRLPSTTTATRTTPYSSIITTTERTYVGASSGSIAVADSSANGAWSYITHIGSGALISEETYTVTGNETETWGLVKITGYTNSTTVTVQIVRPLSSLNFHSTQQWQMSIFGSNTGYPKTITFHESRMLLGNIGDNKDVLVGSKTNKTLDFENGEGKEGTLTPASGFYYKLSGVSSLEWVLSAQRLILGSTKGIFSLVGASDTGINALQAPIFRKIAASKCDPIRPLFMKDTIFYVHNETKDIGQLIYQQGAFSGFLFKDATRYCKHLFTSGIKTIRQQDNYIWVVTLDGNLKGLTYDEVEQVLAGHKHDLGGIIDNICVTKNELYISIKRTINDTDVKYLEQMSKDIQESLYGETNCLDSSITYSGTAVTIITGLDHLEGETITLLVDGATHVDLVVSGGEVEIDTPAEKYIAGLNFISTFETNEMNEGNRKGSREGKKTKINEIGLKLYNTNGIKIISKNGNIIVPNFNENQIYGEGSPFFTGTLKKAYQSGNTLNPTVKVESFKSLPFTIQSIVAECSVVETS